MNTVYTGGKDARQFKDVIGQTVARILEKDPDAVWLDADLEGCSGVRGIRSERVINCGISEANMVGAACGMSAVGFKPYAHSFGPFASRRVFDQVFLSGGYAGNSITIVGTDPGITAAFNGGTHMPFEDVALYRTIPGAVIFDITDVAMLVDALWQCKDIPGVKYIRVPRKESYPVYAEGFRGTVGRANVLREGGDATIIASGIMVHEAMQAAQSLADEGICAAVIDPYTIKPLDEETIREYAAKTGVVVTAENHNKIGGLYSAVKECLNGEARVGHVAVEDEFGQVGPQDYLRTHYGLTAEHIVQQIKALLG